MSATEGAEPLRQGADRFEFAYTLEPSDIQALYQARQKAFSRALRSLPMVGRIYTVTFYALALAAGAVVAGLLQAGYVSTVSITWFVAGAFVFNLGHKVVSTLFNRKINMRVLLELEGLADTPMRVAVDGKGIAVHLPHSVTRYEWQAVKRVDEQPERFLLWLSDLTGLVVPRRAFAGQSEELAFAVAVKEWSSDTSRQ